MTQADENNSPPPPPPAVDTQQTEIVTTTTQFKPKFGYEETRDTDGRRIQRRIIDRRDIERR
jgi:hypothetical protein